MLDKKSNDFNYVQDGSTHLFRGLAFCGKCHAPVTYTKNHGKYFRGICSIYKKLGKNYCNNVNLREDELIQTVMDNLRSMIQEFVTQDDLKIKQTINNDNAKQITQIQSKLKENDNYLVNLYKDKVDGKITEEVFLTLSENISKDKIRLENNLKLLNDSKPPETNEKEVRQTMEQLLELQEDNINRNLLLKLIDKIEINNKNEVKIFYKFREPHKQGQPFSCGVK